MKLSRALALGILAAVLGVAGCYRERQSDSLTGVSFHQLIPTAQDTTPPPPGPPNPPGPPHPPGPPPPPVPVQFAGSDSTREGQTGNTYWRVGNDGGTATFHWRLEMGGGWPGDPWASLPIEGDIRVPARQTLDLTVPVAVPSGTPRDLYPLTLWVTRPGGPSENASGYILVLSDVPPPPPPPPIPAVEFAGVDSTTGQPTISFWLLFNESASPFDMQWTLTSTRNWPGFPINGSQLLSGLERRTIAVTIPVPDSAAAGFNFLFMTVTRPHGLPPQTAGGGFPIVE